MSGLTAPPTAPIDVVVVTHNGGPLLRRCVAALQHQTPPPRTVTVVVSAELPVPLPNLGERVVDLQANPGFATAANAGLATATAPWVLLLNDDTAVQPGFLAALVRAARRPGIYQPCIALADGSGRLDNTGHRLFPDGFNLARGRGQPAAAQVFDAECGAFSGAAVLFSADVLARVGLFDADLEAFGEDVDLSLRARRCGVPVTFVPDAVVRHELGASYGRVTPRKVFLVERNRLRVAVRSLPASAVATMPLWMLLRLVALGSGAATGRGIGAGVGLRGGAAAAAGVVAGLYRVPDALRKRRADRAGWRVGERGMWAHLRRHRVRAADVWART